MSRHKISQARSLRQGSVLSHFLFTSPADRRSVIFNTKERRIIRKQDVEDITRLESHLRVAHGRLDHRVIVR